MLPRFESNRLLDALIFSGVKIDENLVGKLHLEGKAGLKALNAIKNSYRSDAHMSYEQFLNHVEKELKTLSDPRTSSEVRHAVARKLASLADERILQKENSYSERKRFLHKMGQALQGYGFQTKGERGHLLSSKVVKDNMRIYKHQLKMGDIPNREGINALSKSQFKEVLDESLFVSRGKNKYAFYQQLSEEKKELFLSFLLTRDDWYQQTFDIVKDLSLEDFKAFMKRDMALQFQPLKHEVMEMDLKQRDPRFYQALAELTIAEYIRKQDYVEMDIFIEHAHLNIREILNSPLKLTEDEIAFLKNRLI